MNCTYCHRGATDVKDTRFHRGRVRRKRTCRSCGKSFFTLEICESEAGSIVDGLHSERLAKAVAQASLRLAQLSTSLAWLKELTNNGAEGDNSQSA